MMPPGGPSGAEDPQKSRELYNVGNHMHNKQVVYFSRVYAAIVGGIFTGMLGVEGLPGILHLVVWQVLFTGLLILKSGVSTEKRYFRKQTELMIEQAFTGTTLLTFILFWTFTYSIVYVF